MLLLLLLLLLLLWLIWLLLLIVLIPSYSFVVLKTKIEFLWVGGLVWWGFNLRIIWKMLIKFRLFLICEHIHSGKPPWTDILKGKNQAQSQKLTNIWIPRFCLSCTKNAPTHSVFVLQKSWKDLQPLFEHFYFLVPTHLRGRNGKKFWILMLPKKLYLTFRKIQEVLNLYLFLHPYESDNIWKWWTKSHPHPQWIGLLSCLANPLLVI